MSTYESGYDPYTPSGGAAAGGSSSGGGSNNKTAHIQAQIDETVGVMRDNIQKVNERGENLSDLQGKTGEWRSAVHVELQGLRRGGGGDGTSSSTAGRNDVAFGWQ